MAATTVSSARNTPPTITTAPRTSLGSVLASAFGPSSPTMHYPHHHRHTTSLSSPSSSAARSFKYPPTSTSTSSSSSSTLNENCATAGTAAVIGGSTPPPVRKMALKTNVSANGSVHGSIGIGGGASSGTGTGDHSRNGSHHGHSKSQSEATMAGMTSPISGGYGPGNNNGSGNNNGKDSSPSVFINIGRSTSSMPQIMMPRKRMAQNIASNLTYIATWYFFSTALSIYNKTLMGKDNWNFNMPLFVSSIHAGLHYVITACLMHFFPHIFDATRSGKGGRLTIHSYVTQVVPCAVAAALEICMANASLMYITLSFYTMIKSSTPIWVLVFAFFFRLEKPKMSLILIIAVIVFGVFLTVEGEAQFDMTGFVLVLCASIMSGLRWSLTQVLLQKDQLGMDNPVATLYYISPIMFALMSILSLAIEDPFVQFTSSEFFVDFGAGMATLMMAAGGGLLAFAMTVAEFKLIKSTGTVTLSVAGISKEIVIISLSCVIFGDRLTFTNFMGLLVSISGIMAYNYYKIRKMQQKIHGSGDYEILGRHHKGDTTD
ncbi:Triose-phosphate Transporter [Lunasporangiospora selenospora]|uniref:Triose-phosphate Transporter n=1 Tax=Lunasporangiospora selenospora TaxID=979761 RepID=A0A9P6KH30_9FUNG|nr:Triose-phosphate Transporter [Lunasporangiospora selenospora]